MDGENRFLDLMESDQNDPNVQYALGLCCLRGEGTPQDGRAAEKWLRRAAEQGHEEAAALLASVGQETASPAKALTEETLPDWCLRAEEGDAEAQYQVAEYFQRQGEPDSQADVHRYLTLAAEQGHSLACLMLGRQLLETAPREAVQHLRNAADCGVVEAMKLLGQCYARGIGVKRDPQQAEAWFCTMAQRGGGEAMLDLALRYRWGQDVPHSLGRALSWLRRAQLEGVADAQQRYHAAQRAESEAGTEQPQSRAEPEKTESEARPHMDPTELKRRAESGDPGAQNQLGAAYARGEGVPQDWVQAAAWFEKAAQQGNRLAQYNLSTCYYNGTGVERNLGRSADLLLMAAQRNYVEAQYALGYRYYQGEGVKKEPRLAINWVGLAAQNGHLEARHFLEWYCSS